MSENNKQEKNMSEKNKDAEIKPSENDQKEHNKEITVEEKLKRNRRKIITIIS